MKAYVVDSAAVRSNLQQLQTRAGSAVLWAVLKGDGYGLGLLPMAAICQEAGVTHFAVTEVSEVSRLRAGGFADASILNKLSPFFAIIFSFLILKEKITPMQGTCVLLAFIGCLFVVKPGFQNAALIPALIGVCGGLGAGIAYTMVRVLGTHGVKGPIIVFYFSAFSCLFVLPYLIFDYTPMTGKQLVTLLMAGLFAAGGQFTITAAYTYAPAGKISIFDYSQIIFATLLGFFLFGEIPDCYSFIGYGLIILASLGMFVYNMKVIKCR